MISRYLDPRNDVAFRKIWSEQELEAMAIADQRGAIIAAKKDARLEVASEIAKAMLIKNMPMDTIVELTGLSVEEINTIK